MPRTVFFEELIARYGDQAYHKACEFTVIALQLGDVEACRACAMAARELMSRGFHKHERIMSVPRQAG